MFGPTFADELAAAGLIGLPFSWGVQDGSITGRENLADEQSAALDVVIAAHDPTKAATRGTTYKADIWRRATDAEAETIVAVLSQQSVRKQRLFNDATILDHADPEFTELRMGFVQAFGAARADELLAPSGG